MDERPINIRVSTIYVNPSESSRTELPGRSLFLDGILAKHGGDCLLQFPLTTSGRPHRCSLSRYRRCLCLCLCPPSSPAHLRDFSFAFFVWLSSPVIRAIYTPYINMASTSTELPKYPSFSLVKSEVHYPLSMGEAGERFRTMCIQFPRDAPIEELDYTAHADGNVGMVRVFGRTYNRKTRQLTK